MSTTKPACKLRNACHFGNAKRVGGCRRFAPPPPRRSGYRRQRRSRIYIPQVDRFVPRSQRVNLGIDRVGGRYAPPPRQSGCCRQRRSLSRCPINVLLQYEYSPFFQYTYLTVGKEKRATSSAPGAAGCAAEFVRTRDQVMRLILQRLCKSNGEEAPTLWRGVAGMLFLVGEVDIADSGVLAVAARGQRLLIPRVDRIVPRNQHINLEKDCQLQNRQCQLRNRLST